MAASLIVGTLFVSGYEDVRAWCVKHRDGLVVALCAAALNEALFEGGARRVALFSFSDDMGGMSSEERQAAILAAETAYASVRRGLPVLVACSEGRNRACLVAGLVCRLLDRLDGERALRAVRAAREVDFDGRVLTNVYFVEFLRAEEALETGEEPNGSEEATPHR